MILLNHLLPWKKKIKNPAHYILRLTGLRNTWNSCLTSDLSGFTHREAASEQPVVTLLYHKQDKSSGFLSWFARFIWKSMGRLIKKRERRTALSGTREGCSLRGCHITSLVIDYWLHYNESKQFCVILSQLCQILDNNGLVGEDKWIIQHLPTEFNSGRVHIIWRDPCEGTGFGRVYCPSTGMPLLIAQYFLNERGEM